jgi:microcystin-dependent protein
MPCSNCYNGCPDIVSDKCVKYTGLDVPILGIKNGDSLLYVECALADYLASVLNGVGVKPIIDPSIICEVVHKYLPECAELNLNDVLSAVIKAACDLQEQIDDIVAELAVLNAPYDPDCVLGITNVSSTHNVLQNLIHNFCELKSLVNTLELDLDTNYVKLVDLDALIQDYLDTTEESSKYYTKMIPYTVVEYYGSLSNFDATGAGTGDWEKIYLCNGQNGTPDKRGRVPVGAIQLVPGATPNAAVNPANPGNPNYSVGDIGGANTVTLDSTQIPSHTHVATVTDTHYHFGYTDVVNTGDVTVNASNFVARALNLSPSSNLEYTMNSASLPATLGKSSGTQGTLSVTNSNTGGGLSHSNIQPVLACYYIMYIP